MIINLKRVAKIIKEKKANPVIPTDKAINISYDWGALNSIAPAPAPVKAPLLSLVTAQPKPGQLNPLWNELNKVKVERAKLSNMLYNEVNRGAITEELKVLVDSIKGFQPRIENLFDQARHVDQYGTLPKIEVKQEESTPEQKPW